MATTPAQPPATNSPPPSPPVTNSPPPSPPVTNSPPPSPPVTTSPLPSPPVTNSPPPSPPVTSPPPISPPPVTTSPPPNGSPPPPLPKPPENSPPPPSPVNPSPPPPISRPSPPTVQPPTNPPPSPTLVPPLPSSPPPPAANVPPPPSPSSEPPTQSSPPPPEDTKPPPAPPQILVPGSSTNPPQNTPTLSPPHTPNSTSSSSGINTGAVVGITAAVALVLLTLIGLIVYCLRKREKHRLSAVNGSSPLSSSTQRSESVFLPGKRSMSQHSYYSQSQSGGLGNSKALFSYEELVKATNGFSQENLLGEGGFGCVYKGILPDGRVVAVKQLKIGGGQGDREFKNEVETLSRIHHRHLVSIVGHCISGDRRLLIYDYVSNNDLYFHLHGKYRDLQSKQVLDWATRVKIAAGAARGLAYLHEDCHPRIIHRDIKSSNILLEDNFDARVSDFGLARLALDCNTHITTRVMGTFGYMAPEYASSGKLTEKSDVFSFGVVLLELITGRKPVDTSQPLGDESLVEWARPLVSHAIENEEFDSLADPKLEGKYVDSEMFRMIEAAGACVRHSAAKRPRMGQIVRAFESLAAEDLTNGMRLGESEVFNSAQQSAEIRLFRRMAFGSQNYSIDFFTHTSYGSRD